MTKLLLHFSECSSDNEKTKNQLHTDHIRLYNNGFPSTGHGVGRNMQTVVMLRIWPGENFENWEVIPLK
jgi:hypothetical protein